MTKKDYLDYFKTFIKPDHDDYFLVKKISEALDDIERQTVERTKSEIITHGLAFKQNRFNTKALEDFLEVLAKKEN